MPHLEEHNIADNWNYKIDNYGNITDTKSKPNNGGDTLKSAGNAALIDGFQPDVMLCPSSPLPTMRAIGLNGENICTPSYCEWPRPR
jgi:hypothetical protein